MTPNDFAAYRRPRKRLNYAKITVVLTLWLFILAFALWWVN